MGAQLNIKDAATVELARDLARQLGKSVTETIKEALEDKVRAREAQVAARVASVEELLKQIWADMPDDVRGMSSKEIMDSMYDDNEPDGFSR